MLFLRIISASRSQFKNLYPLVCNNVFRRFKSNKQNELAKSNTSSKAELDTNVKPLGEKVKETTKVVSNLGIILFGVGVTGAMFYAIFSELLFGNSPNNIYNKAAKKCTEHPQIQDKLGYPIMAYGEETRRGRRQHVAHTIYADREGKKHLRMKFYLKGTVFTGTANLDMIENDSGDYKCRYLFVEVDDMLRNVIIIEDNRDTQFASNLELQL